MKSDSSSCFIPEVPLVWLNSVCCGLGMGAGADNPACTRIGWNSLLDTVKECCGDITAPEHPPRLDVINQFLH